jgi:2-haloacid dehalogenase
MSIFKPKFINFDCHCTLIYFQMAPMAQKLYADRITPEQMPQFVADFSSYRLDEVLGAWQPYAEVVRKSLTRLCKRWNIEYRDQDAVDIYNAVPTWGPHPDVSEPLKVIAKEIPLVILSNADNAQIHSNVKNLEAPFAHVFTAEDAQSYKPRMRGFEFMLDHLGCGPEDILHVSSSLRYDLMTAHDLGIKNKVFVNRGHEPGTPYYSYTEIKDIGGLPGLVGL